MRGRGRRACTACRRRSGRMDTGPLWRWAPASQPCNRKCEGSTQCPPSDPDCSVAASGHSVQTRPLQPAVSPVNEAQSLHHLIHHHLLSLQATKHHKNLTSLYFSCRQNGTCNQNHSKINRIYSLRLNCIHSDSSWDKSLGTT